MTRHGGFLAADGGWVGEPPRSICIVMLSAIGDAVHVLPVATALKRAFPATTITWIIQPVAHRLVQNHPAIDDFVVFERRRGLSGLQSFVEVREALRGRRFDLLLGLQVYLKAGIITALTPSRIKLGFDRARARDGQWLFTNRRIPAAGQHHVQDQYFEFLSYLGVDPEPVEWGIALDPPEVESQRSFFSEIESLTCAVVLGTSKTEKNWHASGYAEVVDALDEIHGVQSILVGGPGRVEREMADEVLRLTRAEPIDALGDDLRRLVWLLDGSDLVISPDTGPLHIARAVGTPCVSLFGYTNPKRSGPWRAFTDLIVDGYAEYPGEEYPLQPGYRDGMNRVTVEGVLEKVSLALARIA